MFTQTPIEAAQAKNLDARSPHTVEVRWVFFPHTGGKYRHYLKQKEHIELQIRWLAILSTDELYRVKVAIDNGFVPSFFKDIVDTIYQAKQKGQHVVEITVGDNISKMPLFDYEDEKSWKNPMVPNHEVQSGPVQVLLPKRNKVPTQPVQQLPPHVAQLLAKARRQANSK